MVIIDYSECYSHITLENMWLGKTKQQLHKINGIVRSAELPYVKYLDANNFHKIPF